MWSCVAGMHRFEILQFEWNPALTCSLRASALTIAPTFLYQYIARLNW